MKKPKLLIITLFILFAVWNCTVLTGCTLKKMVTSQKDTEEVFEIQDTQTPNEASDPEYENISEEDKTPIGQTNTGRAEEKAAEAPTDPIKMAKTPSTASYSTSQNNSDWSVDPQKNTESSENASSGSIASRPYQVITEQSTMTENNEISLKNQSNEGEQIPIPAEYGEVISDQSESNEGEVFQIP